MINIYAPGGDFILPYIKRATGSAGDDVDVAVMISSTDIYLPSRGWADEDSPIDASSEWEKYEKDFNALHGGDKHVYILRCAPVIGTGMRGKMRTLAGEIYRGLFFHFPGNEARMSVIHASDVGRAVDFLVRAGAPSGVYNLTDGVYHTLHDIAEAMAFRMGNKRISNLSTRPQQIIGRWIYGRDRYRRYTTSELFSSGRLQALGFKPNDTCEYMRTHVYDDSSL